MKTIVNLADIQSGSVYAVIPKNAKRTILSSSPDEEDREVPVNPNRVQKILQNQWYKLAKKWYKPDILVCVGEGCEGIRQPTEIWSSVAEDQANACTELIKAFNPKQVYFIRATEWHTCSNGIELDNLVAKQFGKNNFFNDLSLQVDDVKIHYAHHIGVSNSVFQYRTTAIARELAFNLLNLDHLHDYNIVVRGHAHYLVEVVFGHHTGIILPCWQAPTPYMKRKGPLGMIPTLGAVRFLINGSNYSIEKDIFRLPKPKLVKT